MPWKVKYVPERAVVEVTALGEIRNEDAKTQSAKTIRLMKRHGVNCVLVDYAEAVSEVSLPTLYWLPEYYFEAGVPWEARVAVVLPRMRYRLESYEFYALVCRNAGYDVRLFTDKAAAEDWLAEESGVRERGETLHR